MGRWGLGVPKGGGEMARRLGVLKAMCGASWNNQGQSDQHYWGGSVGGCQRVKTEKDTLILTHVCEHPLMLSRMPGLQQIPGLHFESKMFQNCQGEQWRNCVFAVESTL